MYINQILELSMEVNADTFRDILSRAYEKGDSIRGKDEKYIDDSLETKGIIVVYHASQYKKKIKMIVNLADMAEEGQFSADKLIRKLDNKIGKYFEYRYKLADLKLSKLVMATNIDAGDCENVKVYLKLLQRIGRVKKYRPVQYGRIDRKNGFCLEGNSNGAEFLIYDLEDVVSASEKRLDIGKKEWKKIHSETKGILRAEVHLSKWKTIKDYTAHKKTADQIRVCVEDKEKIFLTVFMQVVPPGDFYKKEEAEEIIRARVEDWHLRRQMLNLLCLIPEKKSIYLAQKAMNCRNIKDVMEMFAKINLSPVTISKRSRIKYAKSIYGLMIENAGKRE